MGVENFFVTAGVEGSTLGGTLANEQKYGLVDFTGCRAANLKFEVVKQCRRIIRCV